MHHVDSPIDIITEDSTQVNQDETQVAQTILGLNPFRLVDHYKQVGQLILDCDEETWKDPTCDNRKDVSTIPTRTSSRIPTVTSRFGGRFSLITPMETIGVSLGIFHGSHRLLGVSHVGCSTRVHVPKNCFILFSGFLYHYGDRCVVDGGIVRSSLRLFQYVVEKEYAGDMPIKTHALHEGDVCEVDDCQVCGNYRQILMTNERVNDRSGTWYPPANCDLSEKEDGSVVFGDISTLGWVVVKATWPKNEVELQKELVTVRQGFNRWNKIQGDVKSKPHL